MIDWIPDDFLNSQFYKKYSYYDLIDVECIIDQNDYWDVNVIIDRRNDFEFKHISEWDEEAIFREVFKQISKSKIYSHLLIKRLLSR